MNQSEISDDDELEIGEEYSFFIYPNRSGNLFATQNMPDITKDKYDFAKSIKTDRDGAHVDIGLPRSASALGRFTKVKDVWPVAEVIYSLLCVSIVTIICLLVSLVKQLSKNVHASAR